MPIPEINVGDIVTIDEMEGIHQVHAIVNVGVAKITDGKFLIDYKEMMKFKKSGKGNDFYYAWRDDLVKIVDRKT